VTIGYGGITILADINKTHATNPAWTPHARFHVVWQVASYAGIGLTALALIWTPGPATVARLYLAAAFAAAAPEREIVACATFTEARQWLDRNLGRHDVVLIENDLPDLYERPLRL